MRNVSHASLRSDLQQLANTCIWLAKFGLGLSVLFSAFRLRGVIFSQAVPSVYSDYTDLLFFVGDAFILFTLIAWIVSIILKPRRLSAGPIFLSIPLVGLLLASLLSIPFSINPLLSGFHAVRMIVLVGLFFFVVNEIHSLEPIAWGVAGHLAIQGSVGIVQVLRQRSTGLEFMGELVLNPAWNGVSIVWAEGTRSLRAYGLSDHPNLLGGCLAFALLLLAGHFLGGKLSRQPVVLAVFFLGTLALLLTFSRSAWLGLGFGIIALLYPFIKHRQADSLRLALSLGIGIMLVMAPFLWYNAPVIGIRLNAEWAFQDVEYERRSLSERLALNQAGNQLFTGHAITGVGLGGAPLAMQEAFPAFPYYYQPPHNVLLNAAVDTGILGGLFYAILLVAPWLALFVSQKKIQFAPHLAAASGALAAITIVGFFDYYPWLLTAGRFWQWLLWGLWASFYTTSKNNATYD